MSLASGSAAVWVVDDSAIEADMARRALGQNYEVTVLTDGSAALERLSHQAAPDVLVLDWQMPGVSGIDVCHFLRSHPATEQLPVLMLTAQAHTRDLVEALSAGADDYLSKPYQTSELCARVAALVRGKRMRERLAQAELTVRKLLRNLPDALITIDPQGALRFVNREAERILGGDPSTLVGRNVRDVLPSLQLDKVAASQGVDLYPLPDVTLGERVYAPIVRELATDEASDTTISLRDVTDRRRADARRMDFYSIIAHDLRAPLGVVTVKADVILRGLRGEISPEIRADITAMRHRITELLAMTDDFLDLARIEGVGIKLGSDLVDIVALARESVDDFRLLAEARGIEMRIDSTEPSVQVVGDRRRLTQVINNLLSNAIKFSRDKGVVVVQITTEAGAVKTEVQDSGVGIRPESLASLFHRYARAVDTEHKVAGTGLGLMIVREIVEAHGGKVIARSESGVGSVFGFTLPATTPARVAPKESPSSP